MNDGKDIRSSSSPSEDSSPGNTEGGDRFLQSLPRKPKSLIGSIVDNKYRILDRLGIGATGIVYKAEHIMMSRVVALKMLHRHLMGVEDDEFFKRFRREARTASKIEHPNAVTLYDFGVHDEQAYIVMQYNPGRTLENILADQGSLSPRRTLQIMEQVCPPIAAAHKLGIIHRDLKPDNIMCRTDEEGIERVQVLDFGLAKVVDDPEGPISTMTKTGVIMGTPHYMAPEQVLGKQLDSRSDVYSLGIVLYEMLTGDVPFSCDSAVELMLKHVFNPPPPIHEILPDGQISSELEAVVDRALKKDPQDRQQSVLELLEGIRSSVIPDIDETTENEEESKEEQKEEHNSMVLDALSLQTPVISPTEVHLKIKRQRRWGFLAIASMVLFGVTLGVLSDPIVTHFSPKQIAQRTEAIERQKRAQLHIDLANEFIKTGKLTAAAYELTKALEKNPKDARIYYQLGTNYITLKNLDQAAEALENAIKLEPDYSEAHFLLGNIYFKQHKLTKALAQYKRTLQLDPKNKMALKNFTLCREALRSQ